jgi:D-3-phosphoglycerate dehydrogenase
MHPDGATFDAVESLVLDLLEWVLASERTYDEVMDAWRTSCPRFPVWEIANERGLIAKQHVNGHIVVKVASAGRALLAQRAPVSRVT